VRRDVVALQELGIPVAAERARRRLSVHALADRLGAAAA
jgi:hypothetical protein